MQIFVADFVENCFLYSLYTDGLLTKTLDSSMVPSSSPIQLNTTDLKSLEPNLYAKYPDRLIEVCATSVSEARHVITETTFRW